MIMIFLSPLLVYSYFSIKQSVFEITIICYRFSFLFRSLTQTSLQCSALLYPFLAHCDEWKLCEGTQTNIILFIYNTEQEQEQQELCRYI